MPRLRNACRFSRELYALSACNFLGRLRGRPRLPLIGSMASTVSSSIHMSWTLAALSTTASGMPFLSTTRWRFVPGLPRSVESFQVLVPPRPLQRSKNPARHETNQSGRLGRGGLTKGGATCARLRPRATLSIVASMSSQSRSPSRVAGTPTAARSRERKGCLVARRGSGREGVHLWTLPVRAGVKAR
jgi:hypothetical protein